MSLKEEFFEIYRNFCRGRGFMLLLMIAFAAISIWFGSIIILYSYEGIVRWLLFAIMIYAWVFFLPATIYLIDYDTTKKRPLKLSEIKVKKDTGCDGFS